LKKRYKILLIILSVIVIGLIIPQDFSMPVEGATRSDYNKDTFWYYPWGLSVTHKGVDIFAKIGANLRSSTCGFVLYSGTNPIGGNIVLVLGPKWRLHYYAHLHELNTSSLEWVSQDELIGTVGASGNAKGTPPHLHFSIVTLIPYPWHIDGDRQGWKKMFYLNPLDYLENN
jgi:peptidoglycan LD-endopeptidase LytH